MFASSFSGILLGGHVRAVFTLITIIFVVCVLYTVTSFKEMPLHVLEIRSTFEPPETISHSESAFCNSDRELNYGSINTAVSILYCYHFKWIVKVATPIALCLFFQIKDNDQYSIDENETDNGEERKDIPRNSITPHPNASLLMYLKSIIKLPGSIRILCLTNLFSWMAHVCYSLYFTDFVGEAVFGGSPTVSNFKLRLKTLQIFRMLTGTLFL